MQQNTVDIHHPNCFGFLHQSQCQIISFGLHYLENISRKNKQNLNLSKNHNFKCKTKHGECEEKSYSADFLIPLRMENILKSVFLILYNTCS